MFRHQRDREKDRYYLLPGMGGRALRRKKLMMLKAAIVVGLLVSLAIALVIYFLNRTP